MAHLCCQSGFTSLYGKHCFGFEEEEGALIIEEKVGSIISASNGGSV